VLVRRRPLMKGIATISPLVVLLAACGGAGAQTVARTPTPVPVTIVSAPPTPIPTPTPPTSYAVGDTVTTTTNASYAVTAAEQVQDTGEFGETPSATGGYFYGVDVKICAGSEQEEADSLNWAVIMSDDTQYEGSAYLDQPSQGPALQAETVQEGACTAGWVYFDLPSSPPSPAKVEVENSDWYWTLSS
jgi:hypothetical protein